MTLQIQHPVAEWYLQFDDLWELMRVNWGNHNQFTQSGMWDAGGQTVEGIVMVIDTPPYRGVLLRVLLDPESDERDHVAIVTYGHKCAECGYQPYNALWSGGVEEVEAIGWGGSIICDLIENAISNPPERLHHDGCSHLTYGEEGDEPSTLQAADE